MEKLYGMWVVLLLAGCEPIDEIPEVVCLSEDGASPPIQEMCTPLSVLPNGRHETYYDPEIMNHRVMRVRLDQDLSLTLIFRDAQTDPANAQSIGNGVSAWVSHFWPGYETFDLLAGDLEVTAVDASLWQVSLRDSVIESSSVCPPDIELVVRERQPPCWELRRPRWHDNYEPGQSGCVDGDIYTCQEDGRDGDEIVFVETCEGFCAEPEPGLALCVDAQGQMN